MIQSAEKGALPLLYAGTDPAAQGGEYYGPGGRGERKGYPAKAEIPKAAKDEEARKRLWNFSEEITGVNYFT